MSKSAAAIALAWQVAKVFLRRAGRRAQRAPSHDSNSSTARGEDERLPKIRLHSLRSCILITPADKLALRGPL